jgi:glycerate dehydrogenase
MTVDKQKMFVRRPNFPHSYKEYESTWTFEEILERLKDVR